MDEGFSNATGMIDNVLGFVGTGARYAAEQTGHGDIAGEIPTGLDDIAATSAVGLTNLLFGADETKGTGTREGEIGAGLGAVGTLMSSGIIPYEWGNAAGRAIGRYTSPGEGTSGTKPGPIAAAAARAHDNVTPSGYCPVPGAPL